MINKTLTKMTVLEKRQALIQKIQEIPEEMLNEVEEILDKVFLSTLSLSENEREKKVREIISNDFKRYKNVFKALA